MRDASEDMVARKLTFAQARTEQLLYWSGKSVAERLAAAAKLTKQLYKMRGIDLDEPRPALVARRVSRRKR